MKFSMDHMADKVTWVTSDAKVVYANIAACTSLGYTMEEMLKLSIPDFDPDFPAEDWPRHWEELKKHGSFTFETRHRTKSGVIYPVEVSINYMRFGDDEYNCGFARDITKRKQIEEELQLSSMVLQTSSEGMLVTDENNQIISVNPAFSRISGYSFEEVKGKNPRMFRSDRHDQAFYQAMWHAIVTTGQWQGEIWDKRKNGETYAKWLTINTLRNKDGAIHRYMALFSDITEKKKSEELIWRQANFDTLTGLPNRDMFRDRLGQEAKKTVRANLPLALLLVDLDQFKEVNDTLGHAMGDMLLKEAARRISACVRESDTVARLGGDEFTIILSEISRQYSCGGCRPEGDREAGGTLSIGPRDRLCIGQYRHHPVSERCDRHRSIDEECRPGDVCGEEQRQEPFQLFHGCLAGYGTETVAFDQRFARRIGSRAIQPPVSADRHAVDRPYP